MLLIIDESQPVEVTRQLDRLGAVMHDETAMASQHTDEDAQFK